MARREVKLQLDEELMTAVERTAAADGRGISEVVESALGRYLGLGDLLERIWRENPNPLNDEEALRIANEEVRAYRAEQQRDAG